MSAEEIVKHFKGPEADLTELAKDYTVPCEALCAELYDVESQLDALEKRRDKLKGLVKSFKDRGPKVYGAYLLDVKDVSGRRTMDKDALLERLVSELGKEEADTYIEAATKIGKPSVSVSVKKLTQDKPASDGY